MYHKFRNDIQTEQAEHNGRVVWDDETKETYYLLMSTVGIEALVKYTDDSIPAVRATFFSGLVEKNADEKILLKIQDKHINDTATFISSPTDVVITWSVKEYMRMTLSYRTGNKTSHIDYAARLAKIRSRFRIIIPGAHHGVIAKDSLLNIDSLTCSEKGISIVSYALTIGTTTMQTGNLLTDGIKSMIRKLKPDERVYFDDITGEGPDKTRRKLGSIVLKVK